MAHTYYIGLMSGTSVDGIDAALVCIDGDITKCLTTHSIEFNSSLRNTILDTCSQELSSANDAVQLDRQLAERYAEAIHNLLSASALCAEDITAIGSHGQTINHAPSAIPPFSLQIGNAQQLANLTGIAVVSNFRNADIAAGGQGAPLAPAFHNYIFRNQRESYIIANLGGIANISILPKDKNADVIGFDTGPANGLMDYWIEQQLGERYDENGRWAASGEVNQGLLSTMLADSYFQLAPPKSTGREHFNSTWLTNTLKHHGEIKPEDVQVTLCELTAVSLCNDIKHYAADGTRLVLCGGGAHNNELISRIQNQLPTVAIESSSTHGIDSDYMEAMAFAWLAYRHINKLSGNLPSVTGAAKEVVLGTLTYPEN